MEIVYELKAEDFYQFGKETASSRKEHQPTVFLLLLTYLLFIFADLFYAYFNGSLKDLDSTSILINIFIRLVLTFVLVFAVLIIFKMIARKKIKNVSEKGANGILCEHKIILTEKELIEVTDINISHYSWKSVGELKESESFIMIEVLSAFSYVIPKKFFKEQSRQKKFVETFEMYKQKSLDSYSPSYFAMIDERKD